MLHRSCIFNKLKVCDNPTPSKSPGVTFPTTFAHFMSVSFCTFDHADDTSTIEKLLFFFKSNGHTNLAKMQVCTFGVGPESINFLQYFKYFH